jgi:type II secretion system protein G
MLLKLRQRLANEESGFTLIELLVVMLIIGILAAIAIPTFFNQKSKAQDSSSKEMAHTVQTALETYATDNGGVYNNPVPTVGDLQAIEPTVGGANQTVTLPAIGQQSYTIEVTNTATDHWFRIIRTVGGAFQYTCGTNVAGETLPAGGCPTSGNWG